MAEQSPHGPAGAEPVEPRLAATVMLLREGSAGLEVFVMHRVAGMAFAPSVTVFPGGGVDPGDHDAPVWSGPDRRWWATALAKEQDLASALVVAAVRELFEETGVLLSEGGLGESERQAVAEHRSTLREVMDPHRLRLRSELLRPWANWITPPGNTRRYDTFFFLAAQPEGQEAQMLTSEAESGRWARPVDLLAEHAGGQLAMMPPTLSMLIDLQRAGTVQWAMSQSKTVTPLTPVVRSRPGEPLEIEADGRVFSLRRQGT
ncbi:NUDIX domain-containing protein [Nakamurella panacisegetis]|uniref:NUDIX domain-containing protein n=1 Tax=Nakamurella panacisegetis TaxID=1090615 RepID=A0A1H0N8B6_9ACTN|nr:NUDIX domain-containing protein [Nakamurella panacisegetis]SDO88969.1 NUDIX domain-containing protein [Nakamurella panacisegetis]